MITGNVKAVEISRSDADPLQFQLCCQNGEFWNINGTLHGTQRRVPTNFIALRSRHHRLESGSAVPLLRNYRSALVMQITFPAEQIKGHFKKIISQPTFYRMQPLNLETINQS